MRGLTGSRAHAAVFRASRVTFRAHRTAFGAHRIAFRAHRVPSRADQVTLRARRARRRCWESLSSDREAASRQHSSGADAETATLSLRAGKSRWQRVATNANAVVIISDAAVSSRDSVAVCEERIVFIRSLHCVDRRPIQIDPPPSCIERPRSRLERRQSRLG